MITDLTKSTPDLFTEVLEEYLPESYESAFTVTQFSLESIDSAYYLTINHTDDSFYYQISNADYSTADFEALMETLLPGYEFEEPEAYDSKS